MSVINRMLKDLEKRSGNADPGVYHPVREARSPVLTGVLAGAVVLLAGALGFMVWQRMAPQTPSAASQVSKASAGEPAPGQSAPGYGASAAPGEAGGAGAAAAGSGAAGAAVTGAAASGMVSVSPEEAARKEREDSLILGSDVSDEELKALEDEIYGPDPALVPEPPAASSRDRRGARTAAVSEPPRESRKKPGTMRVQEVKLTPAQENELDRKTAATALSRGDIPAAKTALRSILAREPKDAKAREKLASLLYGETNLPEAKAVLRDGIATDPSRGSYRLLLARILTEEGRKKEALSALAGYSPKASAENLDYIALEATLATELSEPVLAVDAYSRLTRIMPREGKWWLGLAVAFDRQGSPSAARANYRQALNLGLPEASTRFARQRLRELDQRKK